MHNKYIQNDLCTMGNETRLKKFGKFVLKCQLFKLEKKFLPFLYNFHQIWEARPCALLEKPVSSKSLLLNTFDWFATSVTFDSKLKTCTKYEFNKHYIRQ